MSVGFLDLDMINSLNLESISLHTLYPYRGLEEMQPSYSMELRKAMKARMHTCNVDGQISQNFQGCLSVGKSSFQ